MNTAVLSDLHLGSSMSVLGTPPVRERLVGALEPFDQVVLLGDLLGLRDGPAAEVMTLGGPLLEQLGAALAGRRVVIVPGNHDHRLAEPLLERVHLDGGSAGLAAEYSVRAGDGTLIGAVAERLGMEQVVLSYPGVWVRPDVYATHGHYLDCHLTVPRVDAVLAALMKAVAGEVPERAATPEHYEAVLAPLYAFSFGLAQAASDAENETPRAARLGKLLARQGWHHLKGRLRGGPLRNRVLAGATVVGLVTAINRAGLGSFRADLSGEELGRAGVSAMGAVATRLGIAADHVVFGHTHRAGPLPGEADWRVPGGPRLLNAGGWVYSSALIGTAAHRSPFWPGRIVTVGAGGAPRLEGLLDEASPAPDAA